MSEPIQYPRIRPRRLRATPAVRRLVREHTLRAGSLILPMFVHHGEQPVPISSMPGVVQHSMSSLKRAALEAARVGIGGIMLFGVPDRKDAVGSQAFEASGILNRALTQVREAVGDDLVVMADLCLDEFTDHGHCGLLNDRGEVDNDATLDAYARMARAQARAGAHMLGPSGMMDGQVRVVRDALDADGFTSVQIFAYTAKYASAFYGPFREAVNSSLTGDRRTYQQDPANAREALWELDLDVREGADMVMVKPGLAYLDVLRDVVDASPVPVGAYQVSGEYSMIEAAAQRGWLDRKRTMLESLVAFSRAGASSVLTYYAVDAARLLLERDPALSEFW